MNRGFLAAIVVQAVNDIVRGADGIRNRSPWKTEVIRREALGWIMSESDHEFSFLGICQALDLNEKLIREGLKTLKSFSNNKPGRGATTRRKRSHKPIMEAS